MKKISVALALLASAAADLLAQDTTLQKEAKLRMMHTATRAIANFRAAESIEARLADQGATLHPQLIALRLRIEASLDMAQAALEKGELENVTESLERANALIERFARQIGGA